MKEIDPILLGSNNNVVITNLTSDFYYVPIPKNASSYSYTVLKELGWQYYQIENHSEVSNKTQIVLLREPIDRWCSGFAQEYSNKNKSIDLNDTLVLEKVFENCMHGIHTLPQTYFLQNFVASKTYYINVDSKLTNNLELLLGNIFKRRMFIKRRKKQNTSIMDYTLKDKIKNAISSPKYFEILSNYLAEDLKLYNSVEFYNGKK